MKRIIGLLAMLWPLLSGAQASQNGSIEPFYIGDRIPDLPLHRIVNYKDSAATLSSFGDKLIVLNFWSTYCKSCIKLFPFEDSLQQAYHDKLQIILVTLDPKDKVLAFLKRFDSLQRTKFSLPVVCGDSVLGYLFRRHGVPHQVWLAPDGRLLAQTGEYFLNASTMEQVMLPVLQETQQMRKDGFSESMLRYPRPAPALLKIIEANRF